MRTCSVSISYPGQMKRWVTRVFPVGSLLLVFATGVMHTQLLDLTYRFGSLKNLFAYGLLGTLHFSVAAIAGIPDESDDVQPAILRALVASGVATGSWLLLQAIFPGLLPRRVILFNAALQPLWSFLCANQVLRQQHRQQLKERVCAVVSVRDEVNLRWDCERDFPLPERSFQLIDSVTVDDIFGLGSAAAVFEKLSADDPSLVVLSDDAAAVARVVDAVTLLHRSGVKVRTLAQFYEEYLGKESLSELTKMAMLFDVRTVHHATYRRTKRVIDVIGAGIGLVIALGAVSFVWVGNLFGNRGPLFYSQLRVGQDGVPFQIFKFRTMVESANQGSTEWTSPDDPRITPFGRLLRRAHVDELPQFVNVLRGELSLVGPRPEQPHYVAELIQKEAAYELRHVVKPGITGWAQIKHRYAATEAEAIEKLQYDLYYLRNQSLSLDLRILSRTLRSVIRRHGR
jgi:lipopolysaccharide/colanic/teichoic acid biosynthesis glycosyltransferase